MARGAWTYFWAFLVMTLAVSWVATAMDGGEEGVGDARLEEVIGGSGGGAGGVGVEAGGDGGASDHDGSGDRGDRVMEEGEHSGVGEDAGTEDTFPDLPDLSGEARAPWLRQVSIFEAFTSSSRQYGRKKIGFVTDRIVEVSRSCHVATYMDLMVRIRGEGNKTNP